MKNEKDEGEKRKKTREKREKGKTEKDAEEKVTCALRRDSDTGSWKATSVSKHLI